MNVAETLEEIRRRVAARLARTIPEIPELALPPLEPMRQARAVAEGWAGSMGAVNPRPPGPLQSVAQGAKQLMSRSLRWFAFPQIQFNQGVLASLIRVEDAFADINRNLVVLGQNLVDRQRKEAEQSQRIDEIEAGARMGLSLLRAECERLEKLISENTARIEDADVARREMSVSVSRTFEQMSGDLSRASEQMSVDLGRVLEGIRGDVERGLSETQQSVAAVEQRFWGDFGRYRQELSEELRLVRQRLRTISAPPPETGPALVAASAPAAFDYPRFEETFRGKEDEIKVRQAFYRPFVEGCAPVLDVACGRGEMLELLASWGMEARGVDLDPDMVGRCREKRLAVEQADALAYLEAQSDRSLGAVFSAQFVEHLPVAAYSRLIELAFAKLRSGGRLILETQNPECLAIYSQTFFLDPTHVKPVPAAQLRFLMAEAGFTGIEVHYLSPVGDAFPQLPKLPPQLPAGDPSWNAAIERFNRTYFGFMDYAIIGVRR